jgi:hypothetical protein
VYGLADQNGFMYNFWLYQGSQPQTHLLVLNLIQKLLHIHPTKYFTLYCDSYYGSWKLAEGIICYWLFVCNSFF